MTTTNAWVYEYISLSPLSHELRLFGIKQAQQISASGMSPGAVAVGGDGAETPAVCCVPPGYACGPPVGPCVVVAAWPRLEDRPHRDGKKNPPTPRDFQQGPLAGHAAPSAAHTPSAGSWERRVRNATPICHTWRWKKYLGRSLSKSSSTTV